MHITEVAHQHMMKGEFKEAAAIYEQCLGQYPDNAPMFSLLGSALYFSGSPEKGLACHYTCLHLNISEYIIMNNVTDLNQAVVTKIIDKFAGDILNLGTYIFMHHLRSRMKVTFDVTKNLEQVKNKVMCKPFKNDDAFVMQMGQIGLTSLDNSINWSTIHRRSEDDIFKALSYYIGLVKQLDLELKKSA